ncbi:STAS/SEC14 domain-containing protein [Daejeonella sp.]|uniref:STAS/SEC14 domain-containing protein n=1 Tax=Daejeonella sp. TaxID=2805397 RepID=UPI002715FA39|nr:STAS/SEC14 domain-containing protein [Daejeonella sp.]MDO8992834.1 STAS/SEC14 domain-containing protein [Daejeonella sp.]MDP2412456.1 STAS/SEC14 domain-containing protein [Daejeonella sp.]
MLQLLEFTSDNIIATKADNQLKAGDYEKLHPIVHNILTNGKKVRWYLEVARFDQWSDDKFLQCISHAEDFEKICCVGANEDDKRIVSLLKPFKNAQIRFYPIKNKGEAKIWLKE